LWLPGASHAGGTQSSNPLCSSDESRANFLAGRLLADKLVVADLGTAGFKVVGDLVIILRGAAEQRL